MARRPAGMPEPADVLRLDRAVFLSDYWDYEVGEHVTVLAPSGGGKTHLAYQLLGSTISPDLPGTVLVMKPKDDTVTRFARQLRLRTVRDWPPSTTARVVRRPAGWVLWPQDSTDPDADDLRHRAIFQRCLRMQYRAARKHPNITFADETYSLEHEMRLDRDLTRMWTKGRSVGAGLWAASQRPVWINRWALQAHHLFIAFDPDTDMQQRLGEIGGGIDPVTVRQVVSGLRLYEFIYIHRETRTMCVISP